MREQACACVESWRRPCLHSHRLCAEGLLGRERYVVFNRFQSREGAGPRFEKRWADRKSSLKVLDGFRFFTLLRRADDVELNGSPVAYEEGTSDYMSMTVWETKKNFNSWRTGFAFKEAHGGGSIAGFLSAVVGSMMVLKSFLPHYRLPNLNQSKL